MREKITIYRLILLFGDAMLLYAALLATFALRYDGLWQNDIFAVHLYNFSVLYALWLVIFYLFDLYTVKLRRLYEMAENIFYGFAVSGFISVAYFYFRPDILITPKTFLALDGAIAFGFVVLWHLFFRYFVYNSFWRERVVIFGPGHSTDRLIEETGARKYGFEILGIYDPRSAVADIKGVKVIKQSDELLKTLGGGNATLGVLAYDAASAEKEVAPFFSRLPLNLEYLNIADFYEIMTRKVLLGAVGEIWFLENFSRFERRIYGFFKRLADMILAIVGLLITIIFFPIIAFFIKWDSHGPIFFRQERVGKMGGIFRVIKFRSMVENAESAGAVWARPEDSRITRAGRILRRARLDELPQFWNVLKGEMSIVGPRPERPEFDRELEMKIPFYTERYLVKPGLTGWAQVNFRYGFSAEDAYEKLQYDLYYIKNRSLFLDLEIILKTIKVMFRGEWK